MISRREISGGTFFEFSTALTDLRVDGCDAGTAWKERRGRMGHEETRVAVFLTPAADDYRYADAIIRALSGSLDAPLFEPHLTVCSGLCVDPGVLRERVAIAAQTLSPLVLRVKGVGCTEAYFRSLYIEFMPDLRLAALRDELKIAVDRTDNGVFLPHLSLLYRDMPLVEKETLALALPPGRREFTFDSLKVVTPANIKKGWRDTLSWGTLFRTNLLQR
jgi:putative hydrolase of the HAD superfamily